MLILAGNNLGERHRDLNTKVSEAVDNKTNFDEVKAQEDKCDADTLFKIELASRYKNIDYILEVLKSGDAFHIARALKCLWIYDDEFSNYINVTYLEDNVFPKMSKKMKRKMLTSISINLRNGERAIDFYEYCKEAKMTEYQFKFLVFTTDKFKLTVMRDRYNFHNFRESKYLKQFIGKSIALARRYMSMYHFDSSVIHALSYMYSVSNEEEYLDNLETFNDIRSRSPYCRKQFGIRISRDILKKHKSRVIKRPIVYITQLNRNMLLKYLTGEDVKSLARRLLPPSAADFWSLDFYKFYKFLFDKISTNELFAFMKQIFNSKYRGESFEMYIEFYKLGYYNMLTTDEQEEWALLHIERDKDIPGIENFIWYKFVRFSKAFSGIKRCIFLTPDKDKRSRIVNILPQTVRNQDDLAKMLEYYYQRHVNEEEEHKESFINKVIEHHDIYSFNNECWTLLDKLFYSLEVYSTGPTVRQQYKEISMIYHILHNKKLPEDLQEYVEYDRYPVAIYKLSKERSNVLVNYLQNFHNGKINSGTDQLRDGSIKYGNDCHEERPKSSTPAQEQIKPNVDICESHEELKPKCLKKTEGDFLRWLKRDIELATEGISEIRANVYRRNFRLCRLFRKLKVYFPNDVGKEYLQYFIKYLSGMPKGGREYRNIKMAVVGVFYLADEDFKKEFIEKYVPEASKIDRMVIDRHTLQVQKAICGLVYHSRPYMSLSNILKYVVGDYVLYFLPMFSHYLANWVYVKDLPKALLDAPVSVQHGLRLAFKCYTPETLKSITINIWQKTDNVSLRKLLYQVIFNRILKEKEDGQKELYEVLKLYTAELNHDDHENIYSLLVSEDLPYQIKGDFIETAWLTVKKFSNTTLNLERKTSVVKHIDYNIIYYVQRQFIRLQIIDDHIHDMLYMKNINKEYDTDEEQEFIDAKWSLTIRYIVTFDHGEGRKSNKVEQQRSLELLRIIMTKCVEMWNDIEENTYPIRTFIHDFIKMIVEKDPMTNDRCGHMVPVYGCIFDVLQQLLKKEETYLMAWELKLHMVCRKILHNRPYMSVEEICNKFGKKTGKLIKEMVEKDEFYHCFYHSMASIVNDIGSIICDYYSTHHNVYYYPVSETLTDIKINETYVIAIMMMPTDAYCYGGEAHAHIIRKIKKYDSKEVQTLLYKKYVASDSRVRGYFYE